MKLSTRDVKPVLERILHKNDGSRSDGVHISTIIRDIAMEMEPDKYKKHGDDIAYERMVGGMGWEDLLFGTLQDMGESVVRIGELKISTVLINSATNSNLFGTPDWYDLTLGAIHECKCTWKSSSKWDPQYDYTYWWQQVMAYCYAINCTHATLWVMHVNGDYRGSGPQLQAHDAQFTQDELDLNISMLVNHAVAKGMIPKCHLI